MSYEVIIPLFVLIFIQAYYIEGYLRGYAYKFFSGENLSWNPKHDRMALWGSLIFFITSLLLLSEIFYYKTDDYDSIWPYYDYYAPYAPYVYIVMIFFFTSFIYYIIKTTNKIKNKEAVEKAAKEEKNVSNNITIDKLDSKEIIAAKEEKNVNNNITIDKIDSKEIIVAKEEKNVNINITIDKLDSKEIIAAKEENDVNNNNITIDKIDSKEIERLVEDNKINIDESSKGDLEKLLRGEKIESKIKWIGTSGKKEITYTKIFILLHTIIEGGKEKFKGKKRKSLINFIISNFVKFEKNEEKEISFGSIYGAYTNFPINSLKK